MYRISTPRRYEIESLGAASVLLLGVGFLGVLAGVSVFFERGARDEHERAEMRRPRPICLNGFKPSGLSISPKKFCSPKCRQDASVIKRAAKLLMSSPEKTIIEILSKLSKEK